MAFFILFIPFSGCTLLEVLKLSEVKVTDRGFSLLLATPLTHLQVLDLSKTQITTKSLRLLPAGTVLQQPCAIL